MNTEELQVVAFEIILHSGTARATVHEAFAAMRLGHYDEASQKLEAANTELVEAHHAQTKLLQDYASGVEIKIEIIMVHAQDHLTMAIFSERMAGHFLKLWEKKER